MRRSHTYISFWAALAVALVASAAALTHDRFLPASALGPIWPETLRPILIAVTLVALAAAVLLVYGDPAESQPGRRLAPESRPIAQPALWTVALLSLLSLLFVR
jgi:hypothetical protein